METALSALPCDDVMKEGEKNEHRNNNNNFIHANERGDDFTSSVHDKKTSNSMSGL